jgi:hypothetical protein
MTDVREFAVVLKLRGDIERINFERKAWRMLAYLLLGFTTLFCFWGGRCNG